MKSRLTLPLLVVLTIAGYGYGIQGSVPDVPTGQWTPGASLAQPREGAVSVALDDGRVLIIGGRVAAGPVATVEALNADGSITLLPSLAAPRVGHTAVLLTDGSVLVAGGMTIVATDQGTVEAPTSSAEIFAPGSNTWSAASPLGVARSGHTATALADGRVLIAGGTSEQGPLDSMEVFESQEGTFRAAGVLSAARAEAAAAVAGETRVLVVGGRNADGVLATADLVDVGSGAVAQLTLTSPRAGASATKLIDGTVFVAGGNDGQNDLATAETIDPASGASSPAGSMAQARSGHQATLLDHNATVLIVGGTNNGASATTAETFVPWTNQFEATNPPAAARTNAIVSSTSTEGVAVLAGGKASTGALVASAELYGFATVKTDKDDYAPGTTVVITGSGWQPGEIVNMVLRETGPGAEPDLPLIATADATGRIFNDVFAPNEGDIGRRFYLTVVGVGATAQTTFTDAPNNSTFSSTANGAAVTTLGTVLPNQCSAWWGQARQGNNLDVVTGTMTLTSTPGGAMFFANDTCSGSPQATLPLSFNAASAVQFSFRIATTGPYTIRGAGSWDNNANQNATATVTVNAQRSTSTNVTCATNPVLVGQGTLCTATVTDTGGAGASSPIGTVTFSSDASGTFSSAGTCALVSATANSSTCTGTYTPTVVAPGTHNIGASYAANGAHAGSSDPTPFALTVNPMSTTTTVTSNANPSVFGQNVTFTATVAVLAPGSGTPAGNAEFFDGVTSLGIAALNGSGVATLSTSALAVASHSITAKYLGNASYGQSTSAVLNQTVQSAATTTALTSSVNPSKYGQSVTFTAAVTVNSPGTGTPAGSAEFFDGATSLGTGTLNASGVATLTTSTLAVGSHSITAKYLGSANYNGSTSTVLTQNVEKAGTTTAVTSSANSSKFGQSVTFTATVTVNSPGTGTPAGSAEFFDGGTSLGIGTLNASGVATFTTSALAVASHDITAKYLGNANYNESTSAVLTQTVEKADTTTTVTSSDNPSKFGQSVTFTATVTVDAPGTGTPAGSAEFFDGATSLGTGTLNASGVATFSTSTLAVADHGITAKYLGNGDYNGSTSAVLTQTVEKADTTTTVTSSDNPSKFGQSVTFTATVTVNLPGNGTPSGTVTFVDGATTLGTGTLNTSGVATFTTTSLSVGNHTIKAVYGGDSSFNGSTSNAVTQDVQQADTTTTVTSAPNPSLLNAAVTFTATVNPVAPGAGTRTGTVTFKEGVTVLGTGTVNASGQATFTTSSLSAGSHSITAAYGGDTNFKASTGTTASAQTVNFTFAGFFAPVDSMPVVNSAKAGSAIPTKWRLTDANGAGVSDPSSFKSFTSYMVPCGTWSTNYVDPVPEDYSGNSGLIYQGNGNWQWNWKTPKDYAGQCRIARVTLSDDSVHEYHVKFK